MAASVHSRCSGEGPAVVLLHGLFGAGNNLGALARHLQDDYRVCLLDLPGHGRSAWLPRLDLQTMAAEVAQWLDDNAIAQAHVLGHSLGGKVAMQLALNAPARVQSLVVADIAPVAYPRRHQPVFAALGAVAAAGCASRDEAQAIMQRYLDEPDTIAFLLASLQRGEDGVYDWRFDRAGLEAAYDDLIGAVMADGTYDAPTLFIKGELSDYIRSQDWPATLALFPQAQLHPLAGCGHWLHAQDPQGFNALVNQFFNEALPAA